MRIVQPALESRRSFVRSGLLATLATAMSPLARSATWKETQAIPQTSETALLILDFQVGIGDQPYAKSAAQRAAAALNAGRAAVQRYVWPLQECEFRHCLSSLLLQSTGVAVAQRQLRHADAATTLGHYGHVLRNDHREAMDAIESVFFEPSGSHPGSSGK